MKKIKLSKFEVERAVEMLNKCGCNSGPYHKCWSVFAKTLLKKKLKESKR